MTIWKSGSVGDMPEVPLLHWSIRETDSGSRHFVGYNALLREGRVSTAIISFDARTRIGLTQSGRRYLLEGPAGIDSDAEYVWNTVARLWNVESWRDVTSVLVSDWRESRSRTERVKQMGGCDSDKGLDF